MPVFVCVVVIFEKQYCISEVCCCFCGSMPREIRGENKQESRCIIIYAGAGGKGGTTCICIYIVLLQALVYSPIIIFCQSLHCFVLVKEGIRG